MECSGRRWNCYKTPTFCSLLARCRIPCACTAKRTACAFSTSQLQKVLPAWCVLYILTWKCAWCRNGVHFLDSSTSKNGPRPSVFYTFHFEMCFAPQWRALFDSTSKSAPSMVLYILTSKCASRHNSVQFFISHLTRCLRTRRFSEPTFRPSGATNHWKNTVNRDFSTFSRTCIFFLLTLSLLWSSLFFSSLLFSDSYHLCFFIGPYCRKFDF